MSTTQRPGVLEVEPKQPPHGVHLALMTSHDEPWKVGRRFGSPAEPRPDIHARNYQREGDQSP